MTGAVAVPNYAAWSTLFPEFSNVSAPQYAMYFDLATQYCRNDGCGPVSTVAIQTRLLNLMTAHIAFIFAGDSRSDGASGLVGRINSATEGSVSVGAEMPGANANSAWYLQTKYGAAFWQATAVYRTARYRRGPPNMGAVVGIYNPLGLFPIN